MSETFSYENSAGGSQKPIVQVAAVAEAGQAWSRLTMVGQLTASGKWQILDFDQKANYSDFGFAVEAVDATAGAGQINTSVYVEGEFNQNNVIFDYNDTADDWRIFLTTHGIYLRDSVNTSGY